MKDFYQPYVSVAERRRKASKKVADLVKKGKTVEPVFAATPRGKIAASFWGQAWCEHLESYSDFANRLPRGRTYLRNGSVLHLGITKGVIDALVMGSELYRQTVRIDPLPKAKWESLKQRCQGGIGSLVKLLQGKLSGEIMKIVTDPVDGLFPAPDEIRLDCSCPDWADLCKHLAAILYGIGARLDEAPELLFKLRGVDHTELIRADASSLVARPGTGSGRRRLAADSISNVFGVDMAGEEQPKPVAERPEASRSSGGQPAIKPSGREASTSFSPTGPAVRQLRERLNLSRSAFARSLGVSAPTVANWEAKPGAINPQMRSLAALKKMHAALDSG